MAERGSPYPGYYDVLVLGKTGQGKSSIGNKLLHVESQREFCRIIHQGVNVDSSENYFLTADDLSNHDEDARRLSVTENCKVVANDHIKIRIMDTPGFSDSKARSGVSVFHRNLQIFCKIVGEQMDKSKNWRIRRVLYFIPQRGVPEKADGILQDELQIMSRYFGESIFNCMVIVATNRRGKKHQALGFDGDDVAEVQKVFQLALKMGTDLDIKCPPVIYFAMGDKETEILSKVQAARVLVDEVFVPSFQFDTCSRCGITIVQDAERKNTVCFYVDENQDSDEASKCHLFFINKHSRAIKIIGGLAHVATLGTVYFIGEKLMNEDTWPGFTNSEEVCYYCHRPCGSHGCLEVKKVFNIELNKQSVKILVEHCNELENTRLPLL